MDEPRSDTERAYAEAQAKLDRIATLISHAEYNSELGCTVVRAYDVFEILDGEKRQRAFP